MIVDVGIDDSVYLDR